MLASLQLFYLKPEAIDKGDVKRYKENNVHFIDRLHTSLYFHGQVHDCVSTCHLKQ